MRYFAHCAYKGSNYHGWQRQPNTALTIQALIEKAFHTISRDHIAITGCGRTDAGVHASNYYFHFDSLKPDWHEKSYQLNAVLPYDISVYSMVKLAQDRHARFDAVEREYNYFLHTYKDPFLPGLSYHYKREVDLDRLNQVATLLIGSKDFSAFCKAGSDVKNKNCNLTYAQWERCGQDKYKFTIRANRFLRGMVRLIVGMSLHVIEGKVSEKEVLNAIEYRRPLNKYWSVPAEGLYLSGIKYPFEL